MHSGINFDISNEILFLNKGALALKNVCLVRGNQLVFRRLFNL